MEVDHMDEQVGNQDEERPNRTEKSLTPKIVVSSGILSTFSQTSGWAKNVGRTEINKKLVDCHRGNQMSVAICRQHDDECTAPSHKC